MSAVSVNGRIIGEAEILAEMQYHPAPDAARARALAARALVLRELVRQEAVQRGFEAGGEESIDALLEQAVPVEEPDEAACRAAYERDQARLRAPDLIEAQHILIAAAPDDEPARLAARVKAASLIAELVDAPERFAELARLHSRCASAANGGMLGQITRGSTVPEFETFLFSLDAGEICAAPVASRYGSHVVRCLARAEGRTLPFEHVRGRIADRLRASAWRAAVGIFVARLVAAARIEGVELAAEPAAEAI